MSKFYIFKTNNTNISLTIAIIINYTHLIYYILNKKIIYYDNINNKKII